MSSQEQISIGNWPKSDQQDSQSPSLLNTEFPYTSSDSYKNNELHPTIKNNPIKNGDSNLNNTTNNSNINNDNGERGGGGIFYNKGSLFNSPPAIGPRKLSSESREHLLEKRSGWRNLSSLEKSLSIALGLISVLALALMIAVVIVGVKLNKDDYTPSTKPTETTLYPPWVTTISAMPGSSSEGTGTGSTEGYTEVSTRPRPTSTPLSSTTESMFAYDTCLAKECFRAAGSTILAMDDSVDPCQDFYKFSCGGWLKDNPIPEDKTYFDQIDKMQERLNIEIKNILESDSTKNDPAPIIMAKQFYDSCLNQNLEKEEIGDSIRHLIDEMFFMEFENETFSNLSFVLAKLRKELAGDYIFSVKVDADLEDRDKNAIYLNHLNFALAPVYFEANETDDHLSAYKSLISHTWTIVFPNEDSKSAEIIADNIIEFEKNLSKISLGPSEYKNPDIRIYNRSEENSELEMIESWKSFVDQLYYEIVNITTNGCNNETECEVENAPAPNVIIEDVQFFELIEDILRDTDPVIIENYLKWRVILDYAKDSNEHFRALFLLYDQKIHDVRMPTPRWQSCVEEANYFFGPAISVYYIKDKVQDVFLFKEQLTQIADTVEETFYEVVQELPWISSNETRNFILENLADLQIYSGFPLSLLDENMTELLDYYSDLNITDTSTHFENILDLIRWKSENELKSILKDREASMWIKDFEMQTSVHTFYSYLSNTMHLPIGMLQSPVYKSLEKDTSALNYGSLGMLIGRNLIEAFENTAESYMNGTLVGMWDSDTLNHYQNSTECIKEQFSSYQVSELKNTISINGENTVKMSKADLGGLKVALRAYMSQQKGVSLEQKLPGLDYTPEQLFFVGFAQTLCTAYTNEELFQEVVVGSQAPAPYRVRGTLENMEEFKHAWNCPAKYDVSCSIW